MGKSKIMPEQRALWTKLGEMMTGAGIRYMEDNQNLFKDMIGSFVENGLEGELEDELGTGSTITRTRKRITAGMAQRENAEDQLRRSGHQGTTGSEGRI